MTHYHDPMLKKPTSFNFATDVVDHYATNSPDRQALFWVSSDNIKTLSLSYSYFSTQSHRLAILLCDKLGVKPGDRLLMILPRLPVWWELATACLRTGIVMCPATTLLVESDIAYRCQRSKATVFVGDGVSVGKFLRVREECPTVRHVICVDGGGRVDVIELDSAMASIPKAARWSGKQPKVDNPALIYFTSGTTGHPKLVLHTQISYPLAHTLTEKHWLRLSPDSAASENHVQSLYWNLSEQGWAEAACALFVHDDRSAFSPRTLLSMLNQYPITTLCAPPTIYRQLVLPDIQVLLKKHPPKALTHCTGAGEPLEAERIRAGSMGLPAPGVPLHVIDDGGKECNVGIEGDIAILVDGSAKQDSFFGFFAGYLSENGSLDRRTHASGDGKIWYRTGERATRDAEGYFWFVGRNDDVINSAGYRIGPFEVESTLKKHPAVLESAVVSSPDPHRSEVVKAFVVLTAEYRDGDSSTTNTTTTSSTTTATTTSATTNTTPTTLTTTNLIKELQDFCKRNAAPYKYPRKIEFVGPDFLPKTISGKIKRSELKGMEWSGCAKEEDGKTRVSKL
ncbi:hypothetical protein BDV97DRAFT_374194 [Delphinella strobiligena]|nr:hypothetical protein BDV97DRAFT_374194 [Delphinella strobiligena]